MPSRRAFLIGLASLPLLTPAGRAGAAQTILTLRGAPAGVGPGRVLDFDLVELDAMPQTAFATTTPWHKEKVSFSGVSLGDFLASAGAAPTHIQMIALNDYMVEAEAGELIEAGALLATRANGVPMPVSEKGPIFVIMPFDDRSELRHQRYFSRCVWQLSEIGIAA